MTEAEMIQCAIDEGFAAAAIVDTTQIVFDPSFRPYCEEMTLHRGFVAFSKIDQNTSYT